MDSDPRGTRSPSLASLHGEPRSPVDWRELAAMPPPLLPSVDQSRSHEAWRRLQSYRPDALTLVDRRAALRADVERLVAAEEAERSAKLDGWREQMKAWSSWCELAARVLCGELAAYREAIDTTGCLDDVREVLGDDAIFLDLAPGRADATVRIDATALDMLRTHDSAAIREHTVAATTRVARELLAVLPVDRVSVEATVHAPATELDGHTHVVALTRVAAAGSHGSA